MDCDDSATGRYEPGRIHPELGGRFGERGHQGGGPEHLGGTKGDKCRSIDRMTDEGLRAGSVNPRELDRLGGQVELDESILGAHRFEHVVDGRNGGGVGWRIFNEDDQFHSITHLVETGHQRRRMHQDG